MTLRKKFIILMIPVMLIHLGLCYAMKKVSRKKHELTVQLDNYKKQQGVKILFMGDSHTGRGIDETQIDSSFTLGYYGENNMMNYYKLKYCLENGYPVPRYALFPCDIITFSKGFYGLRSNKFFYYRFIPYSDLAELDDHPWEMYYDYAKTKCVPYAEWQYAMNRVNMDRQKKSKKMFSDKTPEQRDQMVRHFIEDEILQKGGSANLFDHRALDFLKKTITLCRRYHIKPVYLKFPLTGDVFNEVKMRVDSNYIEHRPSEQILEAERVPVLDFEYMYAQHPEMFFDAHHLNKDGQKNFTPVLKRSLDSLMRVY